MNRQNPIAPEGGAQDRATSDKRVAAALRRMIMDGAVPAGSRISEVRVSEMFEVSRTPARMALSALEVEGLIRKRDGRGYDVLEFNFDDLSKAYEVRGVLEGLAAGTLARDGLAPDMADRLRASVTDAEAALESDLAPARIVVAYQEANVVFHETIMTGCGNEFIGFAFARLESLPLVRLGTVLFNEEKAQEEITRLRFGVMQHRLILDAIERRDAFRAETMMREHANHIPVYTGLFV